MSNRLALSVSAVLFLAGGVTALAAQNLVNNPNFDTGLSGWQAEAGASWDGSRDADSSAASGSAKGVVTFLANIGNAVVVSQCIPTVQAGTPLVFGGKIFVPGNQTASGGAFFVLSFYLGPGCTGTPIPGSPGVTPLVTTPDRWTASATTVTAAGQSARIAALVQAHSTGTLEASFDDLFARPGSQIPCIADASTLCLHQQRFQVTATYETGNGKTGNAHAVALTGDSGYLWFFSDSNVEAIVKVIDGCGLGGHFWVFAGGLTNVKVVLTVTDLTTGAVKTYTNPQGRAFQPIQDTAAFICP